MQSVAPIEAAARGRRGERAPLNHGKSADARNTVANAGSRLRKAGCGDAAALASAHVSLSPITAADLSRAKSDGVFIGESLRPVIDCITVSRTARQLMRQNLALAVIYNLVAVPLAVAGFVTPLIAAAAMSGSSLLVTLNAVRLNGTTKSIKRGAARPKQVVATS